ncbi:MAG: taurine dioxygenase [Gammaproteobacteria bacterium]|nr:taurine dioxygenase [Gammaproteobacteria bacterium]
MMIDPLTPAIGAEISGIDLTQSLDDAARDAIYQALLDYQVIFFRDQAISPQAHMEFARSFGELDTPHHVYPHVQGFNEIVLLENDEERPPDTNDWHTDLTFKPNPPFASILHAQEVPVTGGDTIWASMYAAYDALPNDMKSRCAYLSAVHDMGSFRNNYISDNGDTDALNQAMATVGSAVHTVVKQHPITGKSYLYVNQSFTNHILDTTTSESNRLLQYLFNHIESPEFQVRFRWQPNSIAMWDNRVTQHYAVADYLPHYRRMHRITVVNDKRVQPANVTRHKLAS